MRQGHRLRLREPGRFSCGRLPGSARRGGTLWACGRQPALLCHRASKPGRHPGGGCRYNPYCRPGSTGRAGGRRPDCVTRVTAYVTGSARRAPQWCGSTRRRVILHAGPPISPCPRQHQREQQQAPVLRAPALVFLTEHRKPAVRERTSSTPRERLPSQPRFPCGSSPSHDASPVRAIRQGACRLAGDRCPGPGPQAPLEPAAAEASPSHRSGGSATSARWKGLPWSAIMPGRRAP